MYIYIYILIHIFMYISIHWFIYLGWWFGHVWNMFFVFSPLPFLDAHVPRLEWRSSPWHRPIFRHMAETWWWYDGDISDIIRQMMVNDGDITVIYIMFELSMMVDIFREISHEKWTLLLSIAGRHHVWPWFLSLFWGWWIKQELGVGVASTFKRLSLLQ